MTKRYCFTKSSVLAALAALLLAAGCSAVPEAPDAAMATGEAGAGEPRATDRPPTSEEVMYRVFAGEVMGAEGNLEDAAGEYLEAAMQSEDPAIAERATRVALAAQAWQHAVMAADRWVVLQPGSLEAREIAARTMILVGDYVGAEHQMKGIIALMADDEARAWTIIAALLATARNPGKANQVLARLIEDQGAVRNADALFAQSQLAARTGDLPSAGRLAEAAVELEPERADLLAWAGRVAVNLNEEVRALARYAAAWALAPSDNSITMAYAELLRRQGQVDRAQEILQSMPDTPASRFARVAFALESDRKVLAEEIYAGFESAAYPDPLDRAFQAAQAAELLGRIDEALAWYAQVEAGERALVASLRRAFLMADNDDLEGARNLLAQLRIRRDPVILTESFLAEGQILLDAGEPELAFELLTEALELVNGDTQVLYSRALVAVQLDKLDVAEQDLRSIIQAEPENAAALNALGYTLADRTDRFEEAERLINAAYALQPEEASIIDSMGWVYYRLGRMEEAEHFLRDAWHRDQNAEIAAHLGEVLWVLGREDEARQVWQDGVEQQADNEVLLETMQRFGAGQ